MPHHFTETIERGELTFDYQVRAGAAAPWNTLAVLEMVGFSRGVLEDAHEIAKHLERLSGVGIVR